MPKAGSQSSYLNETNIPVVGKFSDSINQNPSITLATPVEIYTTFISIHSNDISVKNLPASFFKSHRLLATYFSNIAPYSSPYRHPYPRQQFLLQEITHMTAPGPC
jgi:hypothetical protein